MNEKGRRSQKGGVKLLLEEGERAFNNQNYKEALSSFENALQRLGRTGDTELRARILLSQGRSLERLGRWKEALEILLEILPMTSSENPLEIEGEVLREIGDLYARRGHADLARKVYKDAIHSFKSRSSHLGEAKVLTSRGALYFEEGKFEEALKYFRIAFNSALRVNDRRLLATLLGNMGILHSVMGNLRKAMVCYRKSLLEHRKTGNLLGISQVYHNLGMAMKTMGRPRNSMVYFKRSLALSTKLGEKNLQAITLLSMSEVLLSLGKLTEADRQISNSLRFLKEQGDNLGIAEAWKLRGILARRRKRWKEAERALMKSANIFRRYKNPLGEAETYRELGVLYSNRGRKEKTWEWLEQSFEIFRRLNASLDLKGVEESLERLERVYLEILRQMGREVEKKDPYTHGHSERVALFSLEIAQKIRYPKEKWKGLLAAAYLHDLGKVMIPNKILKKPAKLTDAEYTLIKEHPVIALNMLKQVEFPWEVKPLIRHHHERWDGNGYPDGLGGERIPIGARIIAVADTFDALTSARPYRPAMSLEKSTEIIREAGESGQLDPSLMRAFLEILDENPSRFEEISSGRKTGVEMLWLEETGIKALNKGAPKS